MAKQKDRSSGDPAKKVAGKKAATPAKKAAPAKKSAAALLSLPSVKSAAPTPVEVHDELTAFWDAFSPLSLAAVRAACAAGQTLDDIGLSEDQAQSCVNKYNSIVFRAPGKGPVVRPTEAKKWLTSKMLEIIKSVTQRAQP